MENLEIHSLSAISHILEARPDRVKQLIVNTEAKGRVDALVKLARENGIAVDFAKLKHDGEPLRAILFPFRYTDFKDWLKNESEKKTSIVVALDHIQDPQNFGAICRTAEGLGASGIIIPKDRSVSVSKGVYHASVGAVETLPVMQVTNLGESLRRMKENNFWILGTELSDTAKTPWEIPSYEKVVLVLGAEGEGMSAGISKTCDVTLKLPLIGMVQSLNVSAACAIFLYELSRETIRSRHESAGDS